MKTIHFITLIIFIGTVIFLNSCVPKGPVGPPAPFLSTVILKLKNMNNPADTLSAYWRQLDPTGATKPDTSKAILNLKNNSTYNAQVLILDETQHPAVIMSDEIKSMQNYYLFFFQPTPIAPANLIISDTSTDIPGTPTSTNGPYLNLVVNRTDLDTNNPPLQTGITDHFVTGVASNGRLRVVLQFEPNFKNGTYIPNLSKFDVNYTVKIY